jgi:predicted type IV restriction endonuclease
MSDDVDFEQGYEAAVQLAQKTAEQRQNLNEAETRLRLIDTLLFDCLGWSREDTAVENHHDGRYADYVMEESRPTLVLEAKRAGESFDLPEGMPRIAKLETLFAAAGDLKGAVDQSLGYALERGMPFAAVSNGRQIVAFLASRQAVEAVGHRSGLYRLRTA